MNLKTRWVITSTVFLLPFIGLLIAGLYWMWLNHFLLIWVLATSTLFLVGWFFSFRRMPKPDKESKLTVAVSTENHEIHNEQVWKKIEAITSRITNDNTDARDVQFYIETVVEAIQTVAEHYHPEQKEALLEIRIPYLLAIIEMVARDLRIGFAENVPASHIITI